MVSTIEENAKLFSKVSMPIYNPPLRVYAMPVGGVHLLTFSLSSGCEMTPNFYFFLPEEIHGRIRVWRHICVNETSCLI